MSFGLGGQALSHSGLSLLMEEAVKWSSYPNAQGGVHS